MGLAEVGAWVDGRSRTSGGSKEHLGGQLFVIVGLWRPFPGPGTVKKRLGMRSLSQG